MRMRPVLDRFWEKVTKTGNCWVWTAYRNPAGYGNFNCAQGLPSKIVLAHRFAWAVHFGAIPEDLKVLHRCDNPACVRPDHLFVGTQQDNVADCVQKQRHAAVTAPDRLPKGEDHHYAFNGKKITRETAFDILKADGRQKDIAERFGVDPSLVSRIKARKIWKDFT
jgi:hypothetical protein